MAFDEKVCKNGWITELFYLHSRINSINKTGHSRYVVF